MWMHSLFGKTLYESRRSLLGWALGLLGTAGLVLVMYPVVSTGSYRQTIENSPEALLRAFGMDRGMDVASGAGYLSGYLFGMMAPLLLMIFAIGYGSRLVAGEEDRGTLDLLASLPVSRARLLLVKAAVLITALVGLGAVLGVTVLAAAPLVDLRVDAGRLVAALVSHVLLAGLFGSLALALGAATGRRGLAIGAATTVAVGAYLLHSLAPLADPLTPLRRASPVYWAIGNNPLLQGPGVGLVAVVAAAALALALGTWAFAHRDLGT